MLCDYAPIIEALLCAGQVAALPKLKHILIGFVPDSLPVAQYQFGIIVIENAFDIFGTGGVIGIAFIESTNLVL